LTPGKNSQAGILIKGFWSPPKCKSINQAQPHGEIMGHSVAYRFMNSWLMPKKRQCPNQGIFCVEVPGYDIPEWREMGSFPEDMYLITEEGFENMTLTPEFPREIFVR
jgi:Xaa-Pro aminopeptidase